MERLTDFELKVIVECCSNYTASSKSLLKGGAQARIVRKATDEMRRRGLITPTGGGNNG